MSLFSFDDLNVDNIEPKTAKTETGSGLGYTIAGSSISSVGTILADLSATEQFKTQLDSAFKASERNANSVTTSFRLQQNQNKEMLQSIDNTLGDKLSERGLRAIKEESYARAASAETGTSGGSTSDAVREAFMTESFDAANMRASSNRSKMNVLRAMDTQYLSSKNNVDSIMLGNMVSVNTNSTLSGLSSGTKTISDTLNMMPDRYKAKLFDMI